jgi:hypothetical protein
MSVRFLSVALATVTIGSVWPTDLTAQKTARNPVRIGKNVHVSVGFPEQQHQEMQIAAHPTDPNLLIVCSIRTDFPSNTMWGISIVGYASRDGGKSWKPTLDFRGPGIAGGDPSCAYGPDGSAYINAFANLPHIGDSSYARIWRSRDGGARWDDSTYIIRTDPQLMVIDWTTGKYSGRIYAGGAAGTDLLSGARSSALTYNRLDRDLRVLAPRILAGSKDLTANGPGPGAVLSDGTLLMPYLEQDAKDYYPGMSIPARPNGYLRVIRSTDGGESFSAPVTVAQRVALFFGVTNGVPGFASDRTNGPFRDRVYAAWTDFATGRSVVHVAYSTDKGATWSKSVAMDELTKRPTPNTGPDDHMPSLAVNKNGVVALSWYDRRENPENLGWTVRVAVSLDGGDTWSQSVRVSDAKMDPAQYKQAALFGMSSGGGTAMGKSSDNAGSIESRIFLDRSPFVGGDYAGLTASADGAFFPIWVDNRNGYTQLYTARIDVDGSALRNGDAELAKLVDYSSKVDVVLANGVYDPGTRLVTLDVILHNTSKDTLSGPFSMRMLRFGSEMGVPSLTASDNGLLGAGAVIKIQSGTGDGRLLPDQYSTPRKLTFRLEGSRPISAAYISGYGTDYITFRSRILGAVKTPEPKTH